MADYVKVSRGLAWLIILFVGMTGPQAVAQTVLKVGPIYNPASKSYFELRQKIHDKRWRQHREVVANLRFKGVQGRLAIVDSYATYMFLMENIRLKGPTWIGLYVDCKTFNAYWVNGKQQLNSEINLWHIPWYRRAEWSCAKQRSFSMMPVWLMPQRDYGVIGNTGFRWMATGPEKGSNFMLVEYPTGSE